MEFMIKRLSRLVLTYLSDRLQQINIKGTPILYCLYTKPVSDIIHRFGLLHHPCADGTQLYITIKKQDRFADKVSGIEQCVSEIKVWMNDNRTTLKLNDKTMFIVFSSKCNVNTFAEQNVHAGGTLVGISWKINNLG